METMVTNDGLLKARFDVLDHAFQPFVARWIDNVDQDLGHLDAFARPNFGSLRITAGAKTVVVRQLAQLRIAVQRLAETLALRRVRNKYMLGVHGGARIKDDHVACLSLVGVL